MKQTASVRLRLRAGGNFLAAFSSAIPCTRPAVVSHDNRQETCPGFPAQYRDGPLALGRVKRRSVEQNRQAQQGAQPESIHCSSINGSEVGACAKLAAHLWQEP